MPKYKIRIFIVLCGFLFMNPIFARESSPENDGDNLFINIQNLGVENCQLVEKNLIQGKLLYSNIPSTLYATGENNEFIIQATYDKKKKDRFSEISLKYTCGGDKTFSLYMKNHQKINYRHRSTDIKFEGVNVYEKHQITPGWVHCAHTAESPVCGGKASKITWMMTH